MSHIIESMLSLNRNYEVPLKLLKTGEVLLVQLYRLVTRHIRKHRIVDFKTGF